MAVIPNVFARLGAALPHSRLRVELLAGLLLAVILAVGVQFFISLRYTQSNFSALDAQRVRENVVVAKNVLDRRQLELEQATATAATLSETSATAYHERDAAHLLLSRIWRSAQAHPALAMVFDEQHRVLASRGRTLNFLPGEPVVRSALRGQPYSEYIAWQGKLWLLASYPLASMTSGQRWGAVVMGNLIDSRTAEQVKHITDTEISFVVGQSVVATTRGGLGPVIDHLAATQFIRGGGHIYVVGDYSIAFEPLPVVGRDGYIVVSVSRQPLEAARAALVRDSLLAVAIALASAMAAAIVLSRRVSRRLAPLNAAATAFAAGDLDYRVPVGSPDEIGAVARTFNRMAEEIAAAHETLRRAAIRDSLTDLLNHREFFRRLEDELARGERHGEPVSVLMIDIDHFKEVNDRYGHLRGDEILRRVASVIVANIRAEDVAARYGGDEFAVALPDADRDYAVGVGERLRAAVAAVGEGNGSPSVKLTLSIGLATAAPGSADANAIVEMADQALYRAKSGGRDRLVVAEPPGTA